MVLSAALMSCASESNAVGASAATAKVVPVTIVATVRATKPAPITRPSNTPISPTATPQPVPAQPSSAFTQLTSGGCCVQPFFSPDGVRVMFIDKPSADAPTGIWAVDVNKPLGQPQLFSESLGPFSRDIAYAVDLVNKQTVVRRLGDGKVFTINNDGRAISFSPDASRIAWSVQEEVGGFDVRRTDVWIARIDGTDARRVTSRYGGGMLAWLPESQRLLIGGKVKRADDKAMLSVLNLQDGSTRDLLQVERLRGGSLSPDGRWFLYSISQARDAALDGVFLLDLNATGAPPRRMDVFGAYRWRDANRLLYVPLTMNAPSNELWQIEMTTGQQARLFAAATDSPFKIANGDWDVARDGTKLIFLSARDRNIWLARLP